MTTLYVAKIWSDCAFGLEKVTAATGPYGSVSPECVSDSPQHASDAAMKHGAWSTPELVPVKTDAPLPSALAIAFIEVQRETSGTDSPVTFGNVHFEKPSDGGEYVAVRFEKAPPPQAQQQTGYQPLKLVQPPLEDSRLQLA